LSGPRFGLALPVPTRRPTYRLAERPGLSRSEPASDAFVSYRSEARQDKLENLIAQAIFGSSLNPSSPKDLLLESRTQIKPVVSRAPN
jgi:hypothetical protein